MGCNYSADEFKHMEQADDMFSVSFSKDMIGFNPSKKGDAVKLSDNNLTVCGDGVVLCVQPTLHTVPSYWEIRIAIAGPFCVGVSLDLFQRSVSQELNVPLGSQLGNNFIRRGWGLDSRLSSLTFKADDVIGVLFNPTTRLLTCYLNGKEVATETVTSKSTVLPAVSVTGNAKLTANFSDPLAFWGSIPWGARPLSVMDDYDDFPLDFSD